MNVLDYCFRKSKKPEIIKEYRLMMYYYSLWEVCMNQFEYTGLPDTLPAEWIEGILITNGTVGIGEYNGKLYAAAGSYQGEINGYIPSEYIACIPAIGDMQGDVQGAGSYDIKGKPNDTIVVGWNNTGMTGELELLDTAQALCEGRTSEDVNVIFSRFLRIPVAKDQKEKAIIDSAIKAITEGRIESVTSATQTFEELINGSSERQFLDLVDVKEVDKLQYLNQYMDNVLKRFMRRHGFSLNITNKLAQQTNAEMHGADDYSMIYPLIQLKYRKQMCDNINKIFGEKYDIKVSVEFSELLKNNYDRVVNYVPDELNEKAVMEGVENTVEDVEKEGDTDETDNQQNDS